MYKVFINDKPVILTETKNIGKFSTFHNIKFKNADDLKFEIEAFESDERDCLLFHHKELNFLWDEFCSLFRIITAAGGIVIKNEHVLMIFRNDLWDLPKGKLEKGESIVEGALREVEEETNVKKLTVGKYRNTTWHTYQGKKNKILKRTEWFEMETKDDSELIPQTEEGIAKVEWCSLNLALERMRNSYQSLNELLKDYSSYSRMSM